LSRDRQICDEPFELRVFVAELLQLAGLHWAASRRRPSSSGRRFARRSRPAGTRRRPASLCRSAAIPRRSAQWKSASSSRHTLLADWPDRAARLTLALVRKTRSHLIRSTQVARIESTDITGFESQMGNASRCPSVSADRSSLTRVTRHFVSRHKDSRAIGDHTQSRDHVMTRVAHADSRGGPSPEDTRSPAPS
jgi:hypothetical protein